MKTKRFLISMLSLLLTKPAAALDVNGNGDKTGVVSLYLFNEGSGNTVVDQITTGGQLNLTVVNPTNFQRTAESIEVLNGLNSGIRSSAPATKIINACKSSNELTIEAWIESNTNNDTALAAYGPARIISLSNGTDVNGGFYLGQGYNGGHFYTLGLNARQRLDGNSLETVGTVLSTRPDDRSVVRQNNLQQVIITKNSEGFVRLFVSDENYIPVLRTQGTLDANFAGWGNNFTLTLGNDSRFDNDSTFPLLSNVPNAGNRTIQDKDWRGKFHMVAIYCTALSTNQILGARAPTNWLAKEQNFTIDPNKPITPARQLAQTIYRRVASYNLPIDHPILDSMELKLSGNMNDLNARLQAAAIASDQAGFYNRTVKDFAKRMSNREHEVAVPLNDFAATIIGIARDNIDAREMLRGDFYYRGHPDKTAVPSNIINDMILSNNHYSRLETLNYDVKDVLQKVNGQVYYDGVSRLVPAASYDAAGVLTSRAFLAAHAVAGTNRRLVEFTFSEFLCRPINQWADNTAPDSYVGRDVDRFPTGDHTKYQTSCRGCHGGMDGFRGAFSRLTFETGFVKHAWVMARDAEIDPEEANNNNNMATMRTFPIGVAGKMNRGLSVFPAGKPVEDSSWINYVTRGANAAYFGWKEGTLSGRGVKEFGNMVAESKAFPDCMTRRVFRAVCKRDPQSNENAMIEKVANSFKTEDNYSLRRLFERVAVQPECLGE